MADHADFHRMLAAAGDHHRGNAAFGEIDKVGAAVARFQHFAHRQIDLFQIAMQPPEVGGRHGGENAVANGFLIGFHTLTLCGKSEKPPVSRPDVGGWQEAAWLRGETISDCVSSRHRRSRNNGTVPRLNGGERENALELPNNRAFP